MRIISAAIVSSAIFLTATLAPAPAAASTCPGPGGTPLACCIYRCNVDFPWPLNHTCSFGCGLNDIVFGNHSDPVGLSPAFAKTVAFEGPSGTSLVLAPRPEDRKQVLLEAGSYATDTDGFEPDSRIVEVELSIVSSDDYVSDYEDGVSWEILGRATWNTASSTWQLVWDASDLSSGDYLMQAEFKDGSASRYAMIPVHVP